MTNQPPPAEAKSPACAPACRVCHRCGGHGRHLERLGLAQSRQHGMRRLFRAVEVGAEGNGRE